MFQIYGAVEFRIADDEWYEIISVSTLLLQHADLNGCLFGVDNYAGFSPLFPSRGLPENCSASLAARAEAFVDDRSQPSWVLWAELAAVEWEEEATLRDSRVSEFTINTDGSTTLSAKWLHEPRWESVKESLEKEPEADVRVGSRLFQRRVLRRKDCLTDTEFPLLMKLMKCLADRYGDDGVRLVVWFG